MKDKKFISIITSKKNQQYSRERGADKIICKKPPYKLN